MRIINSTAQRYIDKISVDCAKQKPLVAIHCITYNHERFLRDALEGFVSQETDFPYVAIVHEDKSTDGTATILREYAEKYPDIIKPIFEEENQYSKPDGSLGSIMSAAINATGAKYVAYCEGDDYWTDPQKLQKQINFLETHSDYTMCCHNGIAHYVHGQEKDRILGFMTDCDVPSMPKTKDVVFTIPTMSFLVLKDVLESEYYRKITSTRHKAFGDDLIRITAEQFGKIRYFKKTMGIYNIHDNGATASFAHNPKNYYYTIAEVANVAGPEYKRFFQKYRVAHNFGTVFMRWDLYPDNLTTAWRMFRFAPLQIMKHVTKAGVRFIANGFRFKR